MHLKAVLRVLVLLPGLSLSTAALAQSAQQVLDTIVTYGAKKVYEMDLDDAPAVGIELDAQVDSDLKACKLTANRGLFCINAAKQVVNWKNPDSDELGDILFNCTKIAEFDPKSSETCTAITLDPAGNIWLAGKNKGKTHSLVKVERCTETSWLNSDGSICTTLWATGRPLLLDIEYIGGEAADTFTYGDGLIVPKKSLGPGVLGLQERKTVVFFSSQSNAVTEISSGKSGWGLVGNEQLQGVTLLQPTTLLDYDSPDQAGMPTEVPYEDDHVLVVTSTGRIITMNTRTLVPEVVGQQSACDSRATQFGIRASAKTGRVYTTSRSCSDFTAYTPKVSTDVQVTSLSLLPDPTAVDYDVNDEPVVIALTTPPEGPTIAPGIGIDLNDPKCKDATGCPITVGATLFMGDSRSSEESGLIVFQVKNIPDCRWNFTKACSDAGNTVISSQDGDLDVPATQYLNVTPLLPSEITDLFTGDKALPPLLVSPQYRGQEINDFTFEAFFYVTESGVRFYGTFDAEYDVAQLAGGSFECKYPGYPNSVSVPGLTDLQKLEYLLKWDVVTRVSDDYASVGGPNADDHVDTLINTDCGSVITKKPGFSLVPYNLEITPHTYDNDLGVVEFNDAVFARLLRKLYGDLGDTLNLRACTNYDVTHDDDQSNDGDNPPLSKTVCDGLTLAYSGSTPKLDRCLDAMYQPKTSAGAQNCQSFWSQFKQFTDILDYAAPNGPDLANRVGELQGRVAVLKHLYETRVAPSVPVGGFCRELYESTGGEEGCQAPAP